MKKYTLNSTNDGKSIGEVVIGENFKTIEFIINPEYKEIYLKTFQKMFDNIGKQGNFAIQYSGELKLRETSKVFWKAYKQALITNLGIFSEEIK